jgi:haloalkane dehalogenase
MARPNHMIRRFYLDVAFGQLHGRRAVAPGKPWLLLLHQSPSSSQMFEALMPFLSDHFSVIAPDNPGFGQSDALDAPSVAAFSACILDVLAHHHIERTFVFGHHTGAAIAAYLGVHAPDLCAGIAMCGPPSLTQEQRKMLPDMAPVEEPEASGEHLARMWSKLRSKETNAPPSLSTRELGLAFSATSTRQAYQAVAEYDFMADLAAITCPLVLFAGDRDSLVGYLPAAAALVPRAKVIQIEDAGGYICDLKPAFVARLLADYFLSEQDGDRLV